MDTDYDSGYTAALSVPAFWTLFYAMTDLFTAFAKRIPVLHGPVLFGGTVTLPFGACVPVPCLRIYACRCP